MMTSYHAQSCLTDNGYMKKTSHHITSVNGKVLLNYAAGRFSVSRASRTGAQSCTRLNN